LRLLNKYTAKIHYARVFFIQLSLSFLGLQGGGGGGGDGQTGGSSGGGGGGLLWHLQGL